MIELWKPNESVLKVIGEGAYSPKKKYRRAYQTVAKETEEGVLFFQTLTKAFCLLDRAEFREMTEGKLDPIGELGNYLLRNRFLVPEETDEIATVESVREIFRIFGRKGEGIRNFEILPTTDCNARCFYCYEAGCKKMTMTKETALRVCDYVDKSRDGEKLINLAWFGGEPLYNSAAIDVITAELTRRKIKFRSDMVSNGYLFDRAMIKKAVKKWNLKLIQITLDGTKEVYNRRKAYIYRDKNAFDRVLKNIEGLLKAGVEVKIRLNMDGKNSADLWELSDILEKRFGKYENCSVYPRLLYQVPDDDVLAYREFERFRESLKERKLSTETKLQKNIRYWQCMADNPESVVILPDGSLTSCEHFNETREPWGNIADDRVDEETRNSYRQYYDYSEECVTCPYLPNCLRNRECPEHKEKCSEKRKQKHIYDIGIGMLNEYNCLKKEGKV